MTHRWPALYSDPYGQERTTLVGSGSNPVGVRIRGVDFTGTMDDLEPVDGRPDGVPFRWLGSSLRDYALEWRLPARLTQAGVRRQGILHVRFGDHERPEWTVMGEGPPYPPESEPATVVILRVGDEEYRSSRRQEGLDEALADLRRELPEDLRLLMCHTCGLAEYGNYGTGGIFGFLMCFRDTPDEIRAVATGGDFKRALDALWPRATAAVGETFLCDRHEPGGSRGTPLGRRPAGDWTPRA